MAVIIVGAVFAFGWGRSGVADTGVRVYDAANGPGARPVEFASVKEAVAHASTKAGFSVPVPGVVPAGYAVTEIDIGPKPPPGIGSNLLRVTFKVRSGGRSFNLMAVNQRFSFEGDDPAHVIASPAKGADIYKVAGSLATDYTLLTPTRGYVISVSAPSPLSDDEAVKVLASLPLN